MTGQPRLPAPAAPQPVERPPAAAQQQRRPLTDEDRRVFLAHVAAGWSFKHAAEQAGRDVRRFYELRDADAAFAAEWREAREFGTQAIEDEIHRRAVEGWDEPVYQGGQLVGHVRKKSDRLLELWHRIRRPELHRPDASVGVAIGKITVNPAETAAAIERFTTEVLRLAAAQRAREPAPGFDETGSRRALPPPGLDGDDREEGGS